MTSCFVQASQAKGYDGYKWIDHTRPCYRPHAALLWRPTNMTNTKSSFLTARQSRIRSISSGWLTTLLVGWMLLLGALPLAHIVGATALYTTATIPFEPASSDPFYRPYQIITVFLTGKNASSVKIKGEFVFDTGSSHCAISTTLAKKMGLLEHPFIDEHGKRFTLNGKPATGITVPTLEIGSLSIKDLPLNIIPDESLSGPLGQPIDGILGEICGGPLLPTLTSQTSASQ